MVHKERTVKRSHFRKGTIQKRHSSLDAQMQDLRAQIAILQSSCDDAATRICHQNKTLAILMAENDRLRYASPVYDSVPSSPALNSSTFTPPDQFDIETPPTSLLATDFSISTTDHAISDIPSLQSQCYGAYSSGIVQTCFENLAQLNLAPNPSIKHRSYECKPRPLNEGARAIVGTVMSTEIVSRSICDAVALQLYTSDCRGVDQDAA